MKPSFKFALYLTVGALCGMPAVLSAEDTSSQPAASAPATTDSSATQPAAPGATQAPDQAPAPKHSHKGGGVKQMVNNLKEKLNLTDDEVTKVTAILQDNAKQMSTIHEDTTLSDDDKKSKLEALRKSTHDQIRAVLTPDQQTTFDSMKMGPGGGHKKADNN